MRHSASAYFVYLLKSLKTNKIFIGLTRDLNEGVRKHNQGHIFWTRPHTPFELVYFEEFESFNEARFRQVRLKNLKKAQANGRAIAA